MNFKNLPILLLLAVPLLWIGCDDNEEPIEPIGNQFEYYFNYSNPNGVSPTIDFEPIPGLVGESSPEVHIDMQAITKSFDGENGVDVIFDNVSVFKEQSDGTQVIYKIDKLEVMEYKNGQWYLDEEFNYFVSALTNIDVVMVLDASNSLANEFPQIQSFVNEFVEDLFAKISDVSVGVVDFSTEYNSLPISSQKELVKAYVNSIELDQYTQLYGAMNEGINLLEASPSTNKALLTFTDGVDNQSPPEWNPDYLIGRLANNPNIASFTIGLGDDGDVQKDVLTDLTANGGSPKFPKNLNDLEQAFSNFSKNITTLHSLTYQRNAQNIPTENKLPLKFVITASPK